MVKQTWISIFGNMQVSDRTITYIPVQPTTSISEMPSTDGTPSQPSHTSARSNLEFEQGTIDWEAKIGNQNCRAQLVFPSEASADTSPNISKGTTSDTALYAGLNVCDAPYGLAVWDGVWKGIGGAGYGSTLPVEEWIPFKLSARGSIVELYVRDIRVVSTTHMLKRGQIGAFLQGNSECAIRNVTVTEDAPMCFVVMQFTDEFNILYNDVIRPVCESYGYRVVRGDDFYTSGQIIDDVTQSIRSAALIIADVTPNNANVFYEVGFAHAIGKPTILLSDRKRERLPFDISGFRTLFYDNTIGGKAVVEARLKQHLDTLRQR